MEEETGNPAPVEERSRLDQDAYLKIVDTYHGRSVLLPHSRIWKEFSPLQNAMYKEELEERDVEAHTAKAPSRDKVSKKKCQGY